MYTLMGSVTSAIAAALLFGLFWKLTKELGKTPSRLPPGPRPLSIIGNVHQLPVSNQHEIFFEWGQKYGDLIYARLFQTPVVITNSIQVARDLMERRGSNFSDRPNFVLFNELMGWGAVLTHLPYGEKFRKQRKWFQAAFQSKTALHAFQALQRRETYVLLTGLTDSSNAFRSHLKRYAAAIIVEIAYGHTVSSLEDEYIEIADRATTETVTAGTPGASILGLLVDFFPILKHYPIWLPGSGFKIRTNEVRRLVNRLFDAPYKMVTERMVYRESLF
ncbi:hypothetical protein PHLCEN_2v8209 [Hermanssonia centrifuga]|uniref:Cytochrome P450 n=1 Tax=Hermanssonia centrifuga TaxID=98765 RepID=A0A2R6NUF5_9APHY|nr:hypothetical protein PHLCEN_2v8209 [Hermanssonia centrifuga]